MPSGCLTPLVAGRVLETSGADKPQAVLEEMAILLTLLAVETGLSEQGLEGIMGLSIKVVGSVAKWVILFRDEFEGVKEDRSERTDCFEDCRFVEDIGRVQSRVDLEFLTTLFDHWSDGLSAVFVVHIGEGMMGIAELGITLF